MRQYRDSSMFDRFRAWATSAHVLCQGVPFAFRTHGWERDAARITARLRPASFEVMIININQTALREERF
jgi:hypothetical protein